MKTAIGITVLMPVFNGEKFLSTAIESILNQTYKEFEFLIINDGSTDSSEEIIKSINDSRIKYIKNEQNLGIVKTLNKGLSLSKGKYIARMDADDISVADRLEKQLKFMQSHTDYKLCGSQAIAIDANGGKKIKLKRPLTDEAIKSEHLFRNSIIHPTAFFEAKIVREIKYSIDHQYAEDYYLFAQIISKYKVANLPESLLYYRIHADNITANKKQEMFISELKVFTYMLNNILSKKNSEENAVLHSSFLTRKFDNLNYKDVEKHLLSIMNSNDKYAINQTVINEWFNFLFYSNQKKALSKYFKSKIFSMGPFNLRHFLKLIFKR